MIIIGIILIVIGLVTGLALLELLGVVVLVVGLALLIAGHTRGPVRGRKHYW